MKPSTQAGAILNKYYRPSIGYGVTVWKFKDSKALDKAVAEIKEAVGEFYMSLIDMRVTRDRDILGTKENFIQIYDN